MSTVDEIKAAIASLSLAERAEIARSLFGWEDDEWDRQVAQDFSAGRLDQLIKQVDGEIDADDLLNPPIGTHADYE
jgi:hypothetical protein